MKHTEQWSDRLTFGTYRLSGECLERQLHAAVALGFRRFDTAQLYRNEKTVGDTVRALLPHDAAHITTKVRKHDYALPTAERLRLSATHLGGLDRVLLHQPLPHYMFDVLLRHSDNAEIGVSNYSSRDIDALLQVGYTPVVNQIEFHPWIPRLRERVAHATRVGVPLQAHTVLVRGCFLDYPPLLRIAQQKEATPAQVLLRFALDSGIDAVVTSTNTTHLAELVAAAKASWRLTELELAEMYSWHGATDCVPHVIFSFQPAPPPAAIDFPDDPDEFVQSVAETLTADLAALNEGDGKGDSVWNVSDTHLSLPRQKQAAVKNDLLSHRIAKLMFPHSSQPISQYQYALKRLRGASMEKQLCQKESGGGKSCSLSKYQRALPYKTSHQVLEPEAMPVTVAPLTELAPMFQYLASTENDNDEARELQFVRGKIFADGRMDMCKQVVGSEHIAALCDAVAASPGRVKHFLLGNNVCCQQNPMDAARALGRLMSDDSLPIQTWYLAGNAIGADATKVLTEALSHSRYTKALWLKRNPIKVAGAAHLSRLLLVNDTIRLLDLHNTGLLDTGVEALLRPIVEQKRPIALRHLYLDANGISEIGAYWIARLITAHPYALESLYVTMNPIGNAGAHIILRAIIDACDDNGCALRRLAMSSCNLSDSVVCKVAEAAKKAGLKYLGLGYYKATHDIGERGNRFTSEGVTPLVELVNDSDDLRCLEIKFSCVADGVERLRNAARLKGTVWLDDGLDAPVTGNITKAQQRAGIRHPPCVVNIDSIYRGKM